MKGIGSISLELESGGSIHLNNILYVPGLKKNLLSISFLKDKCDRIAFVDDKVFVLGKSSSIDNSRVIRIHERTIYKLLTTLYKPLLYLEVSP